MMILPPGSITFASSLKLKSQKIIINKKCLNIKEAEFLAKFQIFCLKKYEKNLKEKFCFKSYYKAILESLDFYFENTEVFNFDDSGDGSDDYNDESGESGGKFGQNKNFNIIFLRLLEIEDILLSLPEHAIKLKLGIDSKKNIKNSKKIKKELKNSNHLKIKEKIKFFLTKIKNFQKIFPLKIDLKLLENFIINNSQIKNWNKFFYINNSLNKDNLYKMGNLDILNNLEDYKDDNDDKDNLGNLRDVVDIENKDHLDIIQSGALAKIINDIFQTNCFLNKKRKEILALAIDSIYNDSKTQNLTQSTLLNDLDFNFIQFGENLLNINAKFENNELMNEYYLKMKKILKSSFFASLVAETDYFLIKNRKFPN